jgi:acetoin utilization deacetylase AcuC-like enzyme
MTKNKLIVLSSVPPLPVSLPETGSSNNTSNDAAPHQERSPSQYALDQLDDFNHPRQRRDIILDALQQEQIENQSDVDCNIEITFDIPSLATSTLLSSGNGNGNEISNAFHDVYSTVHSKPLLDFLESAWKKWLDLGSDGRDPIGCTSTTDDRNIPSLIPACTPLLRCYNCSKSTVVATAKQRESKHVIGQMSYYCTDSCTPIFHDLMQEMYNDTLLVKTCLERIKENASTPDANPTVYYIIPNHPGHHAAYDCFGGYCYVNHIAALAAHITTMPYTADAKNDERVVILDVDYHCGNGTAAIFQQENCSSDNVMVISIHCDPDYDYPFHMGFQDDSTTNVIHIPLPPGTGWDSGYRTALLQAIGHINEFVPTTLLISLGIDTYDSDPCTIRRAGFTLLLSDYTEMGMLLATKVAPQPLRQTVFVQEGGYRMDVIGAAAKNVVVSYTQCI